MYTGVRDYGNGRSSWNLLIQQFLPRPLQWEPPLVTAAQSVVELNALSQNHICYTENLCNKLRVIKHLEYGTL